VPHPSRFFGEEPALSAAEGVGTTNSSTTGLPPSAHTRKAGAPFKPDFGLGGDFRSTNSCTTGFATPMHEREGHGFQSLP
jgi:hypothetical protein